MDTNIFFFLESAKMSTKRIQTHHDTVYVFYTKNITHRVISAKNYPVRYKEEVLKKENVRREKKQHPDKTY